ncbi:MAG TPA: Sir2 family NAD-dependent protein deacetylase [Beijerinckiaceae bacterium]|jgi:NAD-dependent deacetylase
MIDPRLAGQIEDLKALVERSAAIAGFTGAGISTESGVPDFRSPGSPWLKNQPVPFEAYVRSREARREAWRRKFAMDDLYRGAKPSRGHLALASLVASGKMPAVITQNIDGLQQEAGVPADKVIELHGNGTYATCLDCGRRHELDWVRASFEATGEPPDCSECAGIVKSATISFGQTMPEEPMRRAQEVTLACDLFLAIGSSLVVYPAAGFPVLAKQNGAALVIVNREPTDLDEIADLVINAEIGEVLESFIADRG